jgi:hypothetical protein
MLFQLRYPPCFSTRWAAARKPLLLTTSTNNVKFKFD